METGTWRDGLRPVVRIASKLLILLFAGGLAGGGVILADKLAPRNTTVETIAAVVGIAVGVLIWWPVQKWLSGLVDPASGQPGTGA